ncbi:MAG: ABC transporter ATP-binding protein [Solirubrobacteraceae bacterium]
MQQDADGRWRGKSLRATAVSRSFDGVQALSEVTIEIGRDEVIGLIGPNGAGKTTLINLVTGFDLPTAGAIELEEQDITRWSAHRRARHGLSRTFQHGHMFRDLSVSENVELAALGVGMKAAKARERRAQLLDALGLRGREEAPAAMLSHGEEQKLGVARALASEPRYVLMDEPAAGLSDADVDAFSALVGAVHGEYGAGVLVVDHNVAVIMSVCDRIYVLDKGQLLAQGTPAEIRENIDVSAAYLGSTPLAKAEDDA